MIIQLAIVVNVWGCVTPQQSDNWYSNCITRIQLDMLMKMHCLAR